MSKKIKIFFLTLIMLSSVMLIGSSVKSIADEECNDCDTIQIATEPGDADYSRMSCDCSGVTPTIEASSSEIYPGQSITLWVSSGGLGCPPYNWSVAEEGYSIDAQSNGDFETVTLTAQSGSCGGTYNDTNVVATVTVTDKCGDKKDEVVILNKAGSWRNQTVECIVAGGNKLAEYIDGDTRYVVEYREEGPFIDLGPCTGEESHKACATQTEANCFEWPTVAGYREAWGFPAVGDGCRVYEGGGYNENYCLTIGPSGLGYYGICYGAYYYTWECP